MEIISGVVIFFLFALTGAGALDMLSATPAGVRRLAPCGAGRLRRLAVGTARL